jgi:hypothetical protein
MLMDFAKAHNKPFSLPETGGADTTFPNNLAPVIAASGGRRGTVWRGGHTRRRNGKRPIYCCHPA